MAATANGIEDLSIPQAIITRIIKGTSTASIQVNMQKEAKQAFTKSCTVFISYISMQAADLARTRNRKTITAEDVYDALRASHFDEFVEAVKEDTEAFNKDAREKRSAQTKNLRAKKKGAAGKGAAGAAGASKGSLNEDDDEDIQEAKRVRMEEEEGDEED
ncbi:histone-fold-containing protein, partial [Chytriomyces sp. MP71]